VAVILVQDSLSSASPPGSRLSGCAGWRVEIACL
jgi:hypothetical protein